MPQIERGSGRRRRPEAALGSRRGRAEVGRAPCLGGKSSPEASAVRRLGMGGRGRSSTSAPSGGRGRRGRGRSSSAARERSRSSSERGGRGGRGRCAEGGAPGRVRSSRMVPLQPATAFAVRTHPCIAGQATRVDASRSSSCDRRYGPSAHKTKSRCDSQTVSKTPSVRGAAIPEEEFVRGGLEVRRHQVEVCERLDGWWPRGDRRRQC